MKLRFLFFACFLTGASALYSQADSIKGKLFIIGGGHRSPEFIKTLLNTAQLSKKDYIAVLPMSSEEPDTGYYYIKIQLERACSNTIANLNFTKDKLQNKTWLDSLERAKLIFITGGDQARFMNLVLNTPVYTSIHKAYKNGSTIAGTSAGAAMMSKKMITGNELLGDTTYHETFRKLWINNIEIKEGLGLLDSAIIDQHFIARSRYNRLFSALAQFPDFPCIGIDEATAIIVQGSKATVAGESQVVVISHPQGLQINELGLIKFSDVQMSIYTAGDEFMLK